MNGIGSTFLYSMKNKRHQGAVILLIYFLVSGLCGVAHAQRSDKLVETVLQVPEKLQKGDFRKERRLFAPAGFQVALFAAGLGKARFMTVGPDGTLYVSIPDENYILALPDRDNDGVADRKTVFAAGLRNVHGLYYYDGYFYAAGTASIYRLKDGNGDLLAEEKRVISNDVPGSGGHWTRTIVVGPDRMLYLSAGSSCNACLEEDPRRAAIMRFPLEGGKGELFAKGLRNSVGIAFHPHTGELWASNNGRDWLGNDLPPEELNRIVREGDYGWPYCYGQKIPDPDYGSTERCRHTIPPVVEMQAHSAPLGIAFGEGLAFPSEYRDMLFIAFHGSWNRSKKTGYKLVGIPFKEGKPVGPPQDIITGWLENGKVWGRPVAPVAGADGALYLSDDRAGAVYRITFEKGGKKE